MANYRCTSCGNRTRFDVVSTKRTRAFHHFDLGGEDVVDEEDVLNETIESVTCRWCGSSKAIEILEEGTKDQVSADIVGDSHASTAP